MSCTRQRCSASPNPWQPTAWRGRHTLPAAWSTWLRCCRSRGILLSIGLAPLCITDPTAAQPRVAANARTGRRTGTTVRTPFS
eukprot:2051266-Pyramimonas_sp.AAC.1